MFNFSIHEGIKDLMNGVSLLFVYYDGTDATGHHGPDKQEVTMISSAFWGDNIWLDQGEI